MGDARVAGGRAESWYGASDMDRREFLACSAGAGTVRVGPAREPGRGLIAFRIGVPLWLTEDRFAATLEFFSRERGAVDELAFFTSATHPPLPLEEMERRAARLGEILPRVRGAGMAAGINVLATMGHHEENLANSLQAPWQRVRDITGRECRGSFCPAQPELLDYARRIYTRMAEAGPDFIWIDDDVRLAGHKPVNYGCFCELCLGRFSELAGRKFTRESLREAFDSGPYESRLRIRRLWLEHNRRTIDELFRQIETAVHRVKPGLPLGFMTGDRFYEGYAFSRWAKTLAGGGNAAVRWRPGGGFYSDETPLGLVEKAHAMGRQVAALPASVRVIQSELENFPYQRLRKAAATTVVEAAAHMAAGSTGTAFNVLTMYRDPLEEYLPLYRRIAEARPFYAALEEALGRAPARGIWPAWNGDTFAVANAGGRWLEGGRMPLGEPYVLAETGIPLCYDPAGRTATALCGAAPLAFTEKELGEIFSGGVLMDTEAWQAMESLGLARWTGVQGREGVDADATEVLARHALNGRFAGWSRDCRQSFWWERAWRLKLDPAAETLARMVDYGERDLGPCMSVFRNELGGRVVVAGYYPWSQIHSLSKSTQMKSVCDWLSGGRLPVVCETFAKVVVWSRGRGVVVLNASLDALPEVELRVSEARTEFTHVTLGGGRSTIAAEGNRRRVKLANLAPWSIHLLT